VLAHVRQVGAPQWAAMATGQRYTGKVKSYSAKNGFGFIICPKVSDKYGGTEIFVHSKALEFSKVPIESFESGKMFSFEVHLNDKNRPQASNLQAVEPPATGRRPAASTTASRPTASSVANREVLRRGGSIVVGGGGGGNVPAAFQNSSQRGGSVDKGSSKSKGTGRSKDLNLVPKGNSKAAAAGDEKSLDVRVPLKRIQRGGDAATEKGKSSDAKSRGSDFPTGRGGDFPTGKPPMRRGGEGERLRRDERRGDAASNLEKAPRSESIRRLSALQRMGSAPRESAILDLVQKAAGKAAAVKLSSRFADDGSPLIEMPLHTLNSLLKAAGHPGIPGAADIPDANEGIPGHDGKKVEGPWFVGTLAEYHAAEAYGIVESEAFKEKFGDKPCFVHEEHLDPEGTGTLLVNVGEEFVFPIVEDEDRNAWAWAPLIPKARAFIGSLSKFGTGFGFIRCEALWPVFQQEVYIHTHAVERHNCSSRIGSSIVFNLHISKEGKMQASDPRPPGVKISKSSKRPAPTSNPPPDGKRMKVGTAAERTAVEEAEEEAEVELAPEEDQEMADDLEDGWYRGVVNSFDEDKGFWIIENEELSEKFGRDVVMSALLADEIDANLGDQVRFRLNLNERGVPQAYEVAVEQVAGVEEEEYIDDQEEAYTEIDVTKQELYE